MTEEAVRRLKSELTQKTIERSRRSDMLVIYQKWCKACGICASHCPTFAISMGGFTNQQLISQIEAFGNNKKEEVEA